MMTVKELIAELKGADPDAVVILRFCNQEDDQTTTIREAHLTSVGWRPNGHHVELAHVALPEDRFSHLFDLISRGFDRLERKG